MEHFEILQSEDAGSNLFVKPTDTAAVLMVTKSYDSLLKPASKTSATLALSASRQEKPVARHRGFLPLSPDSELIDNAADDGMGGPPSARSQIDLPDNSGETLKRLSEKFILEEEDNY